MKPCNVGLVIKPREERDLVPFVELGYQRQVRCVLPSSVYSSFDPLWKHTLARFGSEVSDREVSQLERLAAPKGVRQGKCSSCSLS